MNWDVYLRLSVLMFIEVAVWGAWMPVLALRLLGPLKMTGKQTSWIYATFPLACIFSPFASGYLADQWFNAEWIMLASHAAGAVLLFLAARQTKFWGMFSAMFAYSVFYTATLPLLNKLLFRHLPEQATWIFLWATVAWALVGYFLTGLRQLRRVGGDGNDSLYLAAVLSVLAVVACAFQLPTEPRPAGNPMLEALAMLMNINYLIFILVEMVVSGMMQFYFLGTGQFMQDRGISGRSISAAMGVAQAVQAAATIVLLDCFRKDLDDQWTFVVGALCWTVLYLVYVLEMSSLWIVLVQTFYGLGYVFFMICGQMFVGDMRPRKLAPRPNRCSLSLPMESECSLGPSLRASSWKTALSAGSSDGRGSGWFPWQSPSPGPLFSRWRSRFPTHHQGSSTRSRYSMDWRHSAVCGELLISEHRVPCGLLAPVD